MLRISRRDAFARARRVPALTECYGADEELAQTRIASNVGWRVSSLDGPGVPMKEARAKACCAVTWISVLAGTDQPSVQAVGDVLSSEPRPHCRIPKRSVCATQHHTCASDPKLQPTCWLRQRRCAPLEVARIRARRQPCELCCRSDSRPDDNHPAKFPGPAQVRQSPGRLSSGSPFDANHCHESFLPVRSPAPTALAGTAFCRSPCSMRRGRRRQRCRATGRTRPGHRRTGPACPDRPRATDAVAAGRQRRRIREPRWPGRRQPPPSTGCGGGRRAGKSNTIVRIAKNGDRKTVAGLPGRRGFAPGALPGALAFPPRQKDPILLEQRVGMCVIGDRLLVTMEQAVVQIAPLPD